MPNKSELQSNNLDIQALINKATTLPQIVVSTVEIEDESPSFYPKGSLYIVYKEG